MLKTFGRGIALVAVASLAVVSGAGCSQSGAGGSGGSHVAGIGSGSIGPTSSGSHAGRDWTVMVFVNATNNLEPDLLAGVKAMETVGSTANVSIVVEMQTKTMPFGVPFDPQAKRMLLVKDTDVTRVSSPGLDLLGDVDTTSPEEIASFVAWSKARFPAQHYALILCDHGGGWLGYGMDDVNHKSSTAAKLEQIAARSGDALGQRFDIFGFDACLNASIEVQLLLAKVARIGIAHEDSVPAGWNYSQFLGDLVQRPTMDAKTLAQAIVTRTEHFVKGVDPDEQTEAGNVSFQMSAIDLDLLPSVVAAFGRFTSHNAANIPALLPALGVARARSLSFWKNAGSNSGIMVDLGNLAATLGTRIQDADLAATQSAIASAVICQAKGPLDQGATGLSIFFPTSDTGRTLNWGSAGDYSSTQFALATGWDKFLAAYLVAAATHQPGQKAPTLTPGTYGPQISIDVPNTASVGVTLSSGGVSFGTIDLDPTMTSYAFDATATALTDGRNTVLADWKVVAPGSGLYAAVVQLVGAHTQASQAVVLCQKDAKGATSLGLAYTAQSSDGSTDFVVVPSSDLVDAVVIPVVNQVDASGKVTGTTEVSGPISVAGLTVASAPLPPGNYTLTLQPIDWAGFASGSAAMSVTIQ